MFIANMPPDEIILWLLESLVTHISTLGGDSDTEQNAVIVAAWLLCSWCPVTIVTPDANSLSTSRKSSALIDIN